MAIGVNISGAYRDVDKVYVNIGGVWVEAEKGFTKVGAIWEEFYSKQVQNGLPVEVTLSTSMISSNNSQINTYKYLLLDGNLSGSGTGAFYTSSQGTYLLIDFGSGVSKELIEWRYYIKGSGVCLWDIQYSNDASNWNTVYSGLDMSGGAGWKVASWLTVGAYRYWRSIKTNSGTDADYHTELEVYENS